MLPLDPPARLVLPSPISTNNLFATISAKGGRGTRRVVTKEYAAWRARAASMLAAQPPLPNFAQPVEIVLLVGELGVGSGADLDNTFKAYLDALVKAGVIHNDSRKWLRSATGAWVPDVRGCVALIDPAAPAWAASDVIGMVKSGLRELLR